MRTILWDLDGTIADTTQLHYAAWNATMREEGVDYTFAQFLGDFGRNNSDVLPELLGRDVSAEKVRAVSLHKEETFRQLLRSQGGLSMLPGVETWLQAFDAAGCRQVISSSGPMANIVAVVEALRIADYFRALMSGVRLPRGKPDPGIFFNSAAAVDSTPAECMVIEDSIHGIEAARHAGMPSIAVGTLSRDPRLAARLAAVPGPACRAVDSLAELTWEKVERLWENHEHGG